MSKSRISPFRSGKASAWLFASALLVFTAACGKKTPVQPPPPPPAAAPAPAAETQERPSITFTAEPSSIEKGQSAMLRWQVSNATEFSIDNGVGPVGSTGQRQVYPSATTSYTLSATGPGGTETKSVTVNVSSAPPPPPPAESHESSIDVINRDVKDIYFDYDSNAIRDDAQATLTSNAQVLKRVFASDPNILVNVEGNCDERGSAEYNVALGDRRATAAKEFLVQLGVPAERLRTISYGKEKPVCTDATESCYQQNRHDHFAPTAQ